MNNKLNRPENLPVKKLRPFEGHPYKVQDNEEMENLTESIRQNGILSPLIVRPIENTDEYEVVSGHRRLHAAIKAGAEQVPTLIYAIDRDAATILLVDSNLHREHILPSEKAFAYKMKLEAMKQQGKRNDLTSCQLGTKLRTDEQIASDSNESARQIQRYIRLTYLIPEFLDKMDEGNMALSVGVELSYLEPWAQKAILEQCDINDCTPSYSQAFRLHKADRDGLLTDAVIEGVMQEEKANQREMFKLPMEQIRKYVPNANPKQAEDFVLKACEHYRKFLIRQKNRDER